LLQKPTANQPPRLNKIKEKKGKKMRATKKLNPTPLKKQKKQDQKLKRQRTKKKNNTKLSRAKIN
jgi:hypothetical protein